MPKPKSLRLRLSLAFLLLPFPSTEDPSRPMPGMARSSLISIFGRTFFTQSLNLKDPRTKRVFSDLDVQHFQLVVAERLHRGGIPLRSNVHSEWVFNRGRYRSRRCCLGTQIWARPKTARLRAYMFTTAMVLASAAR